MHRAGPLRTGLAMCWCLLGVSRRIVKWVFAKLGFAVFRAEMKDLSIILGTARVFVYLDGHAAHRVGRCIWV